MTTSAMGCNESLEDSTLIIPSMLKELACVVEDENMYGCAVGYNSEFE